MKPFLDENFLLNSDSSIRLYHEFASKQPIIDYHCHLSPELIAKNHQFTNLTEIWLAGDHYKWRAMRIAGINETQITGNASDYEKFLAFAKIVPKTIGNPIFHWTHLELKRYFDFSGELLNEKNAPEVWKIANEKLQLPEFSAQNLLKKMQVEMVGTTDDPIDSLEYHGNISADLTCPIRVLPSFRPDKTLNIEKTDFLDYLCKLEIVSDIEIQSFLDLKNALRNRLDHFDKFGCKSADHGLEIVYFAKIPNENLLNQILQKRKNNESLTENEVAEFKTALLVWLANEYFQRDWIMQFHIGALRNNNARMFKILGADSGFDSIGDRIFAENLSNLLSEMDKNNQLPKTILYCLNPRDNEMIATMCGNFQDGTFPGKIQFGSGWWFNDQKDGMERQLMQLSQLSLLSQFVGMLTDSRSFLSFPRHEYFRRILCEMIGNWIEKGEIPADFSLIGKMIENICYFNAKHYFNL